MQNQAGLSNLSKSAVAVKKVKKPEIVMHSFVTLLKYSPY